jgi:hypothetical protein
MEDSNLWLSGKPPTSFYLEKVVPIVGLRTEDEMTIVGMRTIILDLKEVYGIARGELDVMHEKIRIWQTQSANKRKVLSVE